MGHAAGRRSQPITCHLWGGLGVIFKLRTVVVFLTSHAAGDAGQLVRLPRLRDQVFQRSTSWENGCRLSLFYLVWRQFCPLPLSALPGSTHLLVHGNPRGKLAL